MGRPKELLPFGGDTLLAHLCTTMATCAAPVVVVARGRDQALPDLPAGTDVAIDDEPDRGPLLGLLAGLQRLVLRHGFTEADATVLCGCDMPFLSAAVVRWLLAQLGTAPLVMPRIGGELQPLAAVYRVAIVDSVRRSIAGGARSLRDLAGIAHARVLDESAARTCDPLLRFVENVNTPADYDRLLRASSPPATD